MKLKVNLGIGLVGCKKQSEIEIPEEELEGLTDTERQDVFQEYANEWAANYIEIWWDKEA